MNRLLTWIVIHSTIVKRSLLVGILVFGIGLISGWVPRMLLRLPQDCWLHFAGKYALDLLGDSDPYRPVLRARLHADAEPRNLAFSFCHKYAGRKLVTITFRDHGRRLQELVGSGRHPELCRVPVIVKARLLVLDKMVGAFSPGSLQLYGFPASGPGVRYLLFSYSCPEQVPLDVQSTLELSFTLGNRELAYRYGPMVLEVSNDLHH